MPKPLQFDSGRVRPTEAEEIWREALRAIYEIDRSKTMFSARIDTWDLGGKMLLTRHFTQDEVHFKRTRRRIATSGVDHYLVHCLLGGSLASESVDGQQRVAINSIAVRDTLVENFGFAVNAPMLTLSVPRGALDRLMPEHASLHGATFAVDDPVGALMASHVVALANLVTDMSTEQSRIAADATIGLLASCLLPQVTSLDASRPDARLAPMLRSRALAFIERSLLDADLSVDSLCKALQVSRTSLYDLFAELGGVASVIRAKRLDEALRRLTDPARARERIGEIAYSTGFSSESTFHRAFKERFGCSPSEARSEGADPKPPSTSDSPEALAAKYEAAVRNLRG